MATQKLVADGASELLGVAIAPHEDGLCFVDDAGSGPAANLVFKSLH